MAFIVPIDEIRAIAVEVGVADATVEIDAVRDCIHVTRPDGAGVEIELEIFAAASRRGLAPVREIWEPPVRRKLEAFAADIDPKETPCPRP